MHYSIIKQKSMPLGTYPKPCLFITWKCGQKGLMMNVKNPGIFAFTFQSAASTQIEPKLFHVLHTFLRYNNEPP